MKKLLTVLVGALVFLAGCKGTNEKRGDEHLESKRYRNAINSYLEARKKGGVSEEFFDNFTLALARAADIESKNNPNSALITGYFEQAQKNLTQVTKPEVFQEFTTIMAESGKRLVAQDADFNTVVNGFAKIDTALAIAKRHQISEAPLKSIRKEAEDAFVARMLPIAKNEEDPVVSEYYLLQMNEFAPENADLKAALNKSRLGTRGYFLIFGENIGERPSPRVDKWGYVMAFPTIKISPTSLTGELQFWASTGNNTELVVNKIKLVSTAGEEVFAKQSGSGWCEAEVIVGKKGNERIEKKKTPFKDKGKLMNEFQCGVPVSFSFSQGFIPDYVEYIDEYGRGRKYLGQ
ncbi:MAG: hypothetical protein LBR60_02965 [Fibrobacter sp.]|jgi:hypothetical protein|nr:hypothetical protein [Fibrobacter sp.]